MLVTIPQLVTTTASNAHPLLTAKVRSFAVLGHFCVVHKEISFSTIINLRKPLAGNSRGKGDYRIYITRLEFLLMAVALVMLKDGLSEVHDGQM
jgi:hypothetical protein